eukprot:1894218-Pleurochrysis_carterae.AAC.2
MRAKKWRASGVLAEGGMKRQASRQSVRNKCVHSLGLKRVNQNSNAQQCDMNTKGLIGREHQAWSPGASGRSIALPFPSAVKIYMETQYTFTAS